MAELAARVSQSVVLTLVLSVCVAGSGAGCGGGRVRNAVPDGLRDRAEIPGFPDVRFWGDLPSPGMVRSLREMELAERTEPTTHSWRTVPAPVDFLAVSGGAADGAFGAGLLAGWSKATGLPRFRVVTGISTGSVLATLAFVSPKFDAKFREMYTTVSTSDIYTTRFFLAILSSDSTADNEPLRQFVARHISDEMIRAVAAEHALGRRLFVGTTNLDAQRPVVWDMGAIAARGTPEAFALFRDVLVASAAIPVLLPPSFFTVEADGRTFDEMHVDGAAISQVFLFPAERPLSGSLSERTRRVHRAYVIRNGRLTPEAEPVEDRLTKIAGRSVSTLLKSHGIRELRSLYYQTRRNGIEFHLAYIPESFTEKTNEDFDRAYMQRLFEVGYELGTKGSAWRDLPPGVDP